MSVIDKGLILKKKMPFNLCKMTLNRIQDPFDLMWGKMSEILF